MNGLRRNTLRRVLLIVMLIAIGLTPAVGQAQVPCGEITETTLIAGQNIPVGSVIIENDGQYLYVTYQTDGDWLITETHLDVATLPEDLPQTPKGNAIPGQFAFYSEHDPGTVTVTHTIDRAAWPAGTDLYIAAHSVVVSATGSEETAWAEGTGFPGRDWSMYVSYSLQPCEPPPLEPGVINMQSPTIEVLEGMFTIALHLVRTNGSDGQATVTLVANDITATAGADYATGALVVTFDDGETDKFIEVLILDDAQQESDEQFTVQISSVTGAELGTDTATLCTIIDNDQGPPQ